MHKTYLINKKITNTFFYLLVIILIFFSNKVKMVYADSNNWVEVSKTKAGTQYLDIYSIKNEDNGEIEVLTKYLKIDTYNSKEIEEIIYTMKINCLTNKFKDISVNGKKNLRALWEETNGDKLINDVISDSCKNV